jgi:hypothetical protein
VSAFGVALLFRVGDSGLAVADGRDESGDASVVGNRWVVGEGKGAITERVWKSLEPSQPW